ncbi:MAG: DUF1569 domain-containing protein [Saprospiraceae bacterium]|nr:DUF1569 domain-containing protein [Saprospiraceae bacterium]
MPLPNIFDKEVTSGLVKRINKLNPQSKPLWGKMTIGQMLAHCNVAYEMNFENIHPKPGAIQKFFIKLFAKNIVVSEKPYKKNMRTAPEFIIRDDRDFETEKGRLIQYLKRTQDLGQAYFHNRDSHGFGPLTKTEWNNLFYKHLDHHLQQFGV